MLFVWCLTAPSEFYSFSLHDALPICRWIFSAGSLELQQYYLSQLLLAATGEPLVGDSLPPASGYSLSLRYLFSKERRWQHFGNLWGGHSSFSAGSPASLYLYSISQQPELNLFSVIWLKVPAWKEV